MHHHRSISCSQAAQHFGEHLDTALDRRIREHLDVCPNCVAYLDSLKKVVWLYKRCPSPRLRREVRLRLEAVIHMTH